jgi:hypothetical protein
MEFERWPKFGKIFSIWKKFLALDRETLVSVVRANHSLAVFLRKEGEVAWLESPNGLGATAEFQLRPNVSTTKLPAILLPSVHIPKEMSRRTNHCSLWCERRDAHGKGRLAVKNDVSTPPANTSATQAATPSNVFSWPG